MTIPSLKRIKVESEQDLTNWLSKNDAFEGDVMIVTCNKTSPTKHIAGDRVRRILDDLGWATDRSYTLNGNLSGYVAHRG